MCADTETGPKGINLHHLNSKGGWIAAEERRALVATSVKFKTCTHGDFALVLGLK